MTIIMTGPTEQPTAKRTIPIAPPENACVITWAAAVMLETASMLLTRRPPNMQACELNGRLLCSTEPDKPMCVPCAVWCGQAYYGHMSHTSYKTGPLARAGQIAQQSAALALAESSGPDDLSALLLVRAHMWADHAVTDEPA